VLVCAAQRGTTHSERQLFLLTHVLTHLLTQASAVVLERESTEVLVCAAQRGTTHNERFMEAAGKFKIQQHRLEKELDALKKKRRDPKIRGKGEGPVKAALEALVRPPPAPPVFDIEQEKKEIAAERARARKKEPPPLAPLLTASVTSEAVTLPSEQARHRKLHR
jgi:hypothetical protein